MPLQQQTETCLIAVPDPNSPYSDNADLFSPPAGTFTYPTNPVYAGNAADVVEFRVKPLRDETAFRVTLNALKDPALTGFTIAIGGRESMSRPFGGSTYLIEIVQPPRRAR